MASCDSERAKHETPRPFVVKRAALHVSTTPFIGLIARGVFCLRLGREF
jgi:hypothetical protein